MFIIHFFPTSFSVCFAVHSDIFFSRYKIYASCTRYTDIISNSKRFSLFAATRSHSQRCEKSTRYMLRFTIVIIIIAVSFEHGIESSIIKYYSEAVFPFVCVVGVIFVLNCRSSSLLYLLWSNAIFFGRLPLCGAKAITGGRRMEKESRQRRLFSTQ